MSNYKRRCVGSEAAIKVLLILSAAFAFASVAHARPNSKPNGEDLVRHSYTEQPRSQYPEQEPNDICPGQPVACGDVVTPAFLVAEDSDWYTLHLDAGTTVHIGTEAVNPGDSTDTVIELHFACGSTILAQDDDGGPGYYSLINSYTAEQTGDYNLLVRGYDAGVSGPYQVFFTCAQIPLGACCFAGGYCEVKTESECGHLGGQYAGDGTVCSPDPCPHGTPPVNDTCAGALPIARCTSGSLQGDNTEANDDYNPGVGGCTNGRAAFGKDVVYSMDLQAGDLVDLTYNQIGFNTSFYIITDCGNPAGSCVIGADANPLGEPEVIHWNATATGRYYLILDAYGHGAGGAWTLDYSIACEPVPEACCFSDGSCAMLLPDRCSAFGGTSQGAGTICDPNPCPPPLEACCFADGHCEMATELDCSNAGGHSFGLGTACDGFHCPRRSSRERSYDVGGEQGVVAPTEACRLEDGRCENLSEAACATAGGRSLGIGTDCVPNGAILVPTIPTTWGKIKAGYRDATR